MVTGVLLGLVTWALMAIVVLLLGLGVGVIGTRDRLDAIRRSVWWGFAVSTAIVLGLSLIGPLGTPGLVVLLVLVSLVSGGLALTALVRLPLEFKRPGIIEWTLVLALAGAVVYLAAAALGPVTNYDSGLYHLGAVRYQQDVGLVPGLANLYFPLGYGNSVIPWSAFLGSTPWGINGFRLFNGLLLVLLATETVLRVLQRRNSPGTYLLVSALVFVWIPMVALSDYWVTSPTSDSSVLILTTVAVAYLADAVRGRGQDWWPDLAVAVVTGWVLVSMRPTMAVFALAVLGVALVVVIRRRAMWSRRAGAGFRVLAMASIIIGFVLGVLQVSRDRVLSGWLQYPLSVFAFDVPWLAPDPTDARTATLGAARDPEDLWVAAESWTWISAWIARLPAQWEFWMAVLLTLASGILIYAASRSSARLRARELLLSAAPSGVAVAVWFVASPPAFRFVWGPLFTLTALPGAFAACSVMPRLQSVRAPVQAGLASCVALALLGVTFFSGATRFDPARVSSPQEFAIGPISLKYAVAPIPEPGVVDRILPSGLVVVTPVESDQCWSVYPLCTAQLANSVALLDGTWQNGFRH